MVCYKSCGTYTNFCVRKIEFIDVKVQGALFIRNRRYVSQVQPEAHAESERIVACNKKSANVNRYKMD